MKKTLKAMRLDGQECNETFAIEVLRNPHPAVVTLENSALGTLQFEGVDAFEAMFEIRRFLEAKGFILLCGGARFDAFPSGMCRQMSSGLRAYVHELGVHGRRNGFVGIFDDAPKDRVGTIAQQAEFMHRWWNEKG
jgi:hypothetical protein